MNPTTVCEDTIVQEVTIKAPAERIFEALINPAEILKWWASEGKFQATLAEFDPRPGGKWKMRVAGGGCGNSGWSVVSGEYRTVEPPTLLIFTWNRDEEGHPETVVRWELEENGGVTNVRVTHSGLTSESVRARNNGWWMIVELLQAYAESRV